MSVHWLFCVLHCSGRFAHPKLCVNTCAARFSTTLALFIFLSWVPILFLWRRDPVLGAGTSTDIKRKRCQEREREGRQEKEMRRKKNQQKERCQEKICHEKEMPREEMSRAKS